MWGCQAQEALEYLVTVAVTLNVSTMTEIIKFDKTMVLKRNHKSM